jgi:voltage-gated potassium channel
MVLGFVYLATYSLDVLTDPGVTLVQVLNFLSQSIYVTFALDLIIRLIFVRSNLRTPFGWLEFIRQNWIGLLALAAPMLRSLAILRVLIVLRGISPFISSRISKVGFYVGVALPLVVYTASISVLEAEQEAANANIQNLSDAIWWSLVTVTTVGFGDRYPVTPEGRTVGSFLIFVGIALFSTLTALIASWVMKDKIN